MKQTANARFAIKNWRSIRVNDQWRVCFRWSEGDAYDVEIVGYH